MMDNFFPEQVESTSQLILYAAGALSTFWVIIAASGAFPLLLLWFADYRYISNDKRYVSRAITVLRKNWLEEVGFDPEGVIRPLGIPMVLFRQRDGHAAIAVYFISDNIVTDIVTNFSDDVEVTTSNAADGVTAPLSPGCVMQCLPSYEADELWPEHLEAVALLREQLGADEQPMETIAEAVEYAQRRQIRNVLVHPWLILTIPYRCFVLKRRYRDVTVAEQFERGWINTRALSDLLNGC